ncbi:MAG: hypothetical protein ISS35_01465 [Kiritimatiellae bacterium]|nr:hypothetical protein [Kiritimatiellia bacterium]
MAYEALREVGSLAQPAPDQQEGWQAVRDSVAFSGPGPHRKPTAQA